MSVSLRVHRIAEGEGLLHLSNNNYEPEDGDSSVGSQERQPNEERLNNTEWSVINSKYGGLATIMCLIL